MKSVKGTLAEQNLLKAFSGESQAYNRYALYAKKAKSEGELLSKLYLCLLKYSIVIGESSVVML